MKNSYTEDLARSTRARMDRMLEMYNQSKGHDKYSLGRQHYVPVNSQRTTDLPWNYKIPETDDEKEDDNDNDNNNQEIQELNVNIHR